MLSLRLSYALLLAAGIGCSQGSERDLLLHARLSASATRLRPSLPWPREAEDAIATVRDDQPDTSWKAPVGMEAIVEIDLLPMLRRSVELSKLELGVAGDLPDRVEVALAPACGASASHRLWYPRGASGIDLADEPAGCVSLKLEAGANFEILSFALSSSDPDLELEEGPAKEARTTPIAYPRSGVVEGFYGVPWSWRERRAMVRALAERGLGTYLYAPKNDPKQRELWRSPYTEAELLRFRELASLASSLGVSFVFGLSPFIDFDLAGQADRAVLLEKLESVRSQGVTAFALLADDIELETEVDVDGALGLKHVELANAILHELGGRSGDGELWFVPTAYSDARADSWAAGWDYVGALAELDPSIVVLWTGPDTSSPSLKASDLGRVESAMGRAPVLWENFWANDGGDGFTGRLLLGPLSGRSADLRRSVPGILVNPMIQGALSRLLVPQLSLFLERGSVRDTTARDRIPGQEAESELDLALLESVLEIFKGDAVRGPSHESLEASIEELLSRPDPTELPLEAARPVMERLAVLAVLGSAVHHSGLDIDLVDELQFPLEKARHEGEAGLWAMAALGERLRGKDGSFELKMARAALEQSSASRFELGTGGVSQLESHARGAPLGDSELQAPARDEEAPPPCEVGEELAWSPFHRRAPGLEIRVHGLPGAWADDGLLRWVPTHGGRYRAVVVAFSERGWSFELADLVCGAG